MKHYAIIGLGRFGTSVATTLHELGHEVVVVDENEDNINDLAEYSTHGLIGNATQIDILRAAGVKEVDSVIIAISNFETSIMTALLCKELGVKNLIAKARNDSHGKILERIGVDNVIIPEKDMGKKLAHNLSSKNVVDIITLSPNYDIVEIKVPQLWQGRTIAQLDIRKHYGLNILGVSRDGEFFGNPIPSMDLKPKDNLIIMGATSEISKIENLE